MKPYDKYKGTAEWQLINKAIQELVKNDDIKLFTPEYNVVGYIVKKLLQNESPDSPNKQIQ